MQCERCFHRCRLEEGRTGACRTRANRGGELVSLSYGKLTGVALDPIEKKPLARFHPGSMILSVGSFGCNLRCPFCQNHEISMAEEGEAPEEELSPELLADLAVRLRPRGNIGVAYTYNEPLMNYEYVRDTAALIRERGLYNVLVSNGTVSEADWLALLPLLDAANIDLKGFTPDWYRRLGGDLDTVKRSITLAAGLIHLEIATLIVPGENDSPQEMEALAGWISSLDRRIPLHVSRFFPCYAMSDRRPTPVERVYALAEIAREYLDYVYTGNC